MFKGKISFYKNVDGKEDKIEQEFDDPQAYRDFIRSHPEFTFRDPFPAFNFPYFGNLWDSLDDMIDRRMRFLTEEPGSRSMTRALPEGVRLDQYEEEIRRIEAEKASRESEKKSLEEARDKLKEYIKKFEEAGNKERASQAQEDLKKIEEKMKNTSKTS